MLEDNKRIYSECADTYLENWRDLSKNEILIKAFESSDTQREAYISAAMVKYWPKLEQYYSMCKLVATAEDVHSWVVGGILYAVDNHPWTREDSSIYNDPNGPDKVVNRYIESCRCTFYQQSNRYVRKINNGIESMDSIREDFSEIMFPESHDSYFIDIKDTVQQYFENENYFMAFLIDAIVVEGYNVQSEIKSLTTFLKNMNHIQCEIFSQRYDLPLNEVIEASKYVTTPKRHIIKAKIVEILKQLRYNVSNLEM